MRGHFLEHMPSVPQKAMFDVVGTPGTPMSVHAQYRYYLHLDGQVGYACSVLGGSHAAQVMSAS